MLSEARPFPMDPKMKLESREAISAPEFGYTTFNASGPSTSGTGGSRGADAEGDGGAGWPRACAGDGDGVDSPGRELLAHAASGTRMSNFTNRMAVKLMWRLEGGEIQRLVPP